MFIPETIARKERKVSYQTLAKEEPKVKKHARRFFGRRSAEGDVNAHAA